MGSDQKKGRGDARQKTLNVMQPLFFYFFFKRNKQICPLSSFLLMLLVWLSSQMSIFNGTKLHEKEWRVWNKRELSGNERSAKLGGTFIGHI